MLLGSASLVLLVLLFSVSLFLLPLPFYFALFKPPSLFRLYSSCDLRKRIISIVRKQQRKAETYSFIDLLICQPHRQTISPLIHPCGNKAHPLPSSARSTHSECLISAAPSSSAI